MRSGVAIKNKEVLPASQPHQLRLSFAPRSCHIPALEEPERRRAQHDDVGQQDKKGVQLTRRVTDGEQGPPRSSPPRFRSSRRPC